MHAPCVLTGNDTSTDACTDTEHDIATVIYGISDNQRHHGVY
jgi:hypothetical protein